MNILKLNYLLLLVVCLAITACDDDDDNPDIPDADKLELITKTKDNITVTAEFNRIATAVDAAGLMTVAKVEHDVAAQSVGLELRPTKLLIFGNPAAGTQLMQSDQRIGIDLPLKMLVWENEDGDTQVSYYNATTLTERYSIDDRDEVVTMVDQALENFSGGEVAASPEEVADITDQLLVFDSPKSAEETFNSLVETVEDIDNLSIIAQVMHDKAAESVDLELRPTRLLIFGNPNAGTLLMQENQNIGIDLPLKILVWEAADGSVKIGHYKADFLTERYDIDGQEEIESGINTTLDMIVQKVINE